MKVNLNHAQKTVKLLGIAVLPVMIRKKTIWDIVEKLLPKIEIYLRHRFHVYKIAEVFPVIRERFTGK